MGPRDGSADEAGTVVVGRIGKAHGLRGEVSVEPRTDEPERRLAVGNVLGTRSTRPGGLKPAPSLRIEAVRWHQDRLLVRFEGIGDRTAAEAARGTLLLVEFDPDETPEDPEEFYDHQLVGLRAETTTGEPIGEVAEVVHGAAQDLLVIRGEREVLVPFVVALVPEVDLPNGRLVVEDRPGLLHEIDDT